MYSGLIDNNQGPGDGESPAGSAGSPCTLLVRNRPNGADLETGQENVLWSCYKDDLYT